MATPQNIYQPQTANVGLPTYQPIGVNNPPASSNPVASVPTAQNLSQGQQPQWYAGMYPSSQPQFGSTPYTPQTFTAQGQPGQNISRLANVDPDQPTNAYSTDGMFTTTKNMASGGNSYMGPSQSWNGPINVASSQNSANNPISLFGKGSPVTTPFNAVLNPVFQAKGIGTQATPMLTPTVVTTPRTTNEQQVYRPSYMQYAPINRGNIDSYGNPLFSSGGLPFIKD